MYESEFASVLKVMRRDGNSLSPVLRQAWDGGDLRTLTKNSPIEATAPHVAIVALVTREELLRRIDETELANGFMNRFLIVAAKRQRLLPEGGNVPPEDAPKLEALGVDVTCPTGTTFDEAVAAIRGKVQR